MGCWSSTGAKSKDSSWILASEFSKIQQKLLTWVEGRGYFFYQEKEVIFFQMTDSTLDISRSLNFDGSLQSFMMLSAFKAKMSFLSWSIQARMEGLSSNLMRLQTYLVGQLLNRPTLSYSHIFQELLSHLQVMRVKISFKNQGCSSPRQLLRLSATQFLLFRMSVRQLAITATASLAIYARMLLESQQLGIPPTILNTLAMPELLAIVIKLSSWPMMKSLKLMKKEMDDQLSTIAVQWFACFW